MFVDFSCKFHSETVYHTFVINGQNIPTDIKQELFQPNEFNLSLNYPNPFIPTTTIEYTLQKKGNVVVKIFDSIGKKIKTLVNQTQQSGSYKVIWDGTSTKGENILLPQIMRGVHSRGKGLIQRHGV